MALSALRPRRIEFKTGRIITRTRKATAKAFDTVAREMTKAVRQKISKPSPPPSRPGAHPHSQFGKRGTRLKNTFQVVRKGFTLAVRVPQYGIWLEGGTSRMRARPFIHRNLTTPTRKRFWTKRINNEIRKRVGEKTK